MATALGGDALSKSASRKFSNSNSFAKIDGPLTVLDILDDTDTDVLKKEAAAAASRRPDWRAVAVWLLSGCILLLLYMLARGITPSDVGQLITTSVSGALLTSSGAGSKGAASQLAMGPDVVKELPMTKDDVHVFISTDEADLRPLAVVVNSTIVNAKRPNVVFFHLVIPEENVAATREKLLPLFPDVRIDINRKPIDRSRIEQLIVYKEGSRARRELVSVFNFLPFYLPLIADDMDRIVYLDSDVVVVGDIEELARVDMGGMAAAAVEDCMQTFKQYFDFDQLAGIQSRQDPSKPEALPGSPFDQSACVFNRGVLVMDVRRWREQRMTETIEWWMQQYNAAKEPLYRYGLSQPPFLLTLYRRYHKLRREWNTRGLGRDAFGEKERDYMERIGRGRPEKSPYLSPWADEAKLLHYNGKFKPWRGSRVRPEGEKPNSLCGDKREDCAARWWVYLSPEAYEALSPPPAASGARAADADAGAGAVVVDTAGVAGEAAAGGGVGGETGGGNGGKEGGEGASGALVVEVNGEGATVEAGKR